MKKTICLLLSICFTANLVRARQTAFKVADLLQSNMVVQQNKPFKVWGWAAAGSVVNINTDWKAGTQVTAAADGSFVGIINVPQVNTGDFTKHKITVKNNNTEIVLDDILIGEVWICSGQSNMQFKLLEDKNAATELPVANNPNIRVFNGELNFGAEPVQNIKGKWLPCTTDNVKNFSAVGYYFAKSLQEKLNLPVGVIFSGIGASAAEAYVPKDYLAGDAMLDSIYLRGYLSDPNSKLPVNSGFSFVKVTRPFLLYNAMIHPLINLSVKGFCWYQGETNHMERESYTKLTQTLIRAWRNNFAQGDLPFYYIQIAPFYHEKEDPKLAFDAYFREAQEKVSELTNTAMVVSMDVGEAKNLHPTNKKPLGIRLAKIALNRTYGIDTVSYLGPHYQYISIKGKEVTVFFEEKTVKNGLSTNDHNAPAFFTLAGTDGVFYDAKAIIEGKTVKVVSDKVKKPVAVRYAFTNYPVTNLQNAEGLPALPFRSDNWPEQK